MYNRCSLLQRSYSLPVGDDDSQTENSDMNFKNPGYDGQRGTPGDLTVSVSIFIKKDLDWYGYHC